MDSSQLQAQTSLNIFRSYMKQHADGAIDAKGVISADCYKAWLRSRKSLPSCPEKAFQRALSGHLTGVDGRVPFDEDEEEAILKVLRRKARWECFKHCEVKFGESGFRAKGFHEKAITGEILKSRPKKRAKRAIERLRKLSRLPQDGSSAATVLSSNSSGEEEEEDEEVDEEEETGSSSSSEEEDVTSSPSSEASPDVHVRPGAKRLRPQRSPEAEEDGEEDGDCTETESDFSAQTNYPMASDSSVRALQMQIPTFTTPLAVPAITVLTVLVNTVVSMAAAGLPWIQSISSLARTIMLTRGWFGSPDTAKCEQHMERLSKQYPGQYIIFHDYTTAEVKRRVLLQNEEAIKVFGRISSKHGGFQGIRTPPEELWKVLRCFAEVVTSPANVEHKMQTRLYARQGMVLVEGSLTVDDTHRIVIERARVISELPRSSSPSHVNHATTVPFAAHPSAVSAPPRGPPQPQQQQAMMMPHQQPAVLQPHLLRPAFAPPFAQSLPRPPVPMSHPRLGFWH